MNERDRSIWISITVCKQNNTLITSYIIVFDDEKYLGISFAPVSTAEAVVRL